MAEVWKILDARYGQPDMVSGKLIRELLDMKFSTAAKQDCQKFTELHSAYVKIRNNLREIEILDCLKHGPTINSIVRKMPGQELKMRWAIWKSDRSIQVTTDGLYVVWNTFIEKETDCKNLAKFPQDRR